MDLDAIQLITTLLTLFSYASMASVITFLVCRNEPERPLSECIIASALICFFILQGQVALLSLLPLPRPLNYLIVVHLVVLAGLFWGAWRLRSPGFFQWLNSTLKHGVNTFTRMSWWLKVGIFAVVVYALYFALFGMLANSYDWDGLSYHIPMAIQPFQDGHLGSLGSNLPWVDHYPKGMAIVWYHSLQLSGAIALIPMAQWTGGILLAISIYSLSRRLGGQVDAAICGAILFLATPMFALLSRSSYIDLPTAWATVAVVLFLSPEKEMSLKQQRTFLFALLAFAQAILIKLPIIPIMFVCLAGVYWIFLSGSRGRQAVWSFLKSRRMLIGFSVCMLAALPYWINLFHFGNPLYPVEVNLPFNIVLQGPLQSEVFEQYARTTMGSLDDLSRWMRYPAAWLDLFQKPVPDAFGLNGPAFVLGILILFMIFVLRSIGERDYWAICLSLMGLSMFLIGPLALPRYQLPMTGIILAASTSLISRFPSNIGKWILQSLLLLASIGAISGVNHANMEWNWARGVIGDEVSLMDRLATLPEVNPYGYETYTTQGMNKAIRTYCGAGDILAWNVDCFPTFLWNRDFSNRIVHMPGGPLDFYPYSPVGIQSMSEGQLQLWLERILQLDPDQILLYSDSDYSRIINTAASHLYKIGYQDPPDSGQWRMSLWLKNREASLPGS